MDYLQTTGDRLHDLELDRILARLRTLEARVSPATPTAATPVQSPPTVSAGVRSITPVGGTQLSNDVILAVAGPISIAQSGQTITWTVTHSPASTVTEIVSVGVIGAAVGYAREDHAHRGVHKITSSADAFGDVVFGGAGVSQAGNTFTFAGGGGTGVPSNVLVISPGATLITWVTPAASTEFNASTAYRSRHDLTNATQARLLLFNSSGLYLGTPALAAQFSTDGGATWTCLDGGTGPSLSYAAGTVSSGWITLTAGARADVLLRIVASGGNGTNSQGYGSIYIQAK